MIPNMNVNSSTSKKGSFRKEMPRSLNFVGF
jgi:hypothetical protein